jgi:glycosyltransferase involved in cell wall biosynthesis
MSQGIGRTVIGPMVVPACRDNARVSEISVIVPARDAEATIGATLDALAAQDIDRDYEVIVVDDGSTDATATIAAGANGLVTVLSEAGAGPGPARNRGVAAASGSVLAFTDADCVPEPSWLREGVEALRDADLVQGAVRPDPNAERRPFDRTIWVDGRGALFESANLLARRELFERLGGFEDWLGPVLGKPLAEDVWFGWRARREGARLRFAERAVVHHAVFRRSIGGYVGERLRLAYFPAIVRKIPELRSELLFAGVFLNRRSAAFDAAAAGVAAGLAARSPLPLLATAPYAWVVASGVRRWGRRAPVAALADLVADGVGFAALMVGSARSRTAVL